LAPTTTLLLPTHRPPTPTSQQTTFTRALPAAA
jgi:hypothetical protein